MAAKRTTTKKAATKRAMAKKASKAKKPALAVGTRPAKTDLPGIHGVEMTPEEVFDRYRPAVVEQPICLDDALATARDEARAKEAEIERMIMINQALGQDDNPALGKQLEAVRRLAREAERAAAPATALFRFRSIGRGRYSELVRQHPPTLEQAEAHAQMLEANKKPYEPLPYDLDTFPPALMARSVETPAMSEADFDRVWHGVPAEVDDDGTVVAEEIPPWSEGECGALFEAALAANRVVR